MSVPARQHNEWLSLLEVSGPFLSLPVLLKVFPQGLDAHDSAIASNVRLAFNEWEDGRNDPAIHTAWVEFVLKNALGYPGDYLLAGQSLPAGLEARVIEHGETLRPTYALKSPQETVPRMLVVTYSPGQSLRKPVAELNWKTASPDTRMMTLLHATGVPLGLVTNGEKWLLVAAKSGETTSYITWDAGLWSEEPLTMRAFHALLDVDRFFGVPENEQLPAMMAESAQNQQEVTEQLGFQVRKAVEVLIQALDRIHADQQGQLLDGVSEKALYEAALTVMMRLVFIFSAEERGLLLLGDALYDRHYAISTLRDQLRESPDEILLESRHDAWSRLLATCRVIYGGVAHESLRLPAYGGALFDPDRFPFLEGRPIGSSWRTHAASPLPVNNRTVLHLLESLQFLQVRVPGGGVEPRRLSFRALDIEQIGHVYEGLLDHTAKRANSPVLGFKAKEGGDVEIVLADLEQKATESDTVLVEFLKEKTGRTPAAIARALKQAEPPNAIALQSVCGHVGDLYNRVRSYAHLLREDIQGYPVVIHAGSVYVTSGTDRRSTGTHYTPRSLTEPLVKTTLEPLLYKGVGEGGDATPENLISPAQILALKVCDPACGSGAFLVQTCRYLSELLVEAWGRAEAADPYTPLAVPEAIPSGAHHSEQLLPKDEEERLALARRLVAERCLYGVDVNPMAVEMAKLSLWLVTLHKNRPFTFLDHAIKCGDSLLGLHSIEQVESFHMMPERAPARNFDFIKHRSAELLEFARMKREQLERFTVLDMKDAEFKAKLHSEAETALENVLALADLVVAAGISTAGSIASQSFHLLDAKLEELLLDASSVLDSSPELMAAESPLLWPLRAKAARLLNPSNAPMHRRPFHWLIEFPEVFLHTDNTGFDAVVGNPPFVGGQKITGNFGTDYRDFLVLFQAEGRRGSADLCAYFFLRAISLLKSGGNFGLLAVNTIAEGDTRQVGLEAMLKSGNAIYAAIPNFAWPGAAAVVASAVHFHRGVWRGHYWLNGEPVSTISAFLSGEDEWSPKPLQVNSDKCFQGSNILGLGFTMTEVEARAMILRDSKNVEVLFPYLNGDDLNSHPHQEPSRWVINFFDWPLNRKAVGQWTIADEKQQTAWLREGRVPNDYPHRVAADFPDVLSIVEMKVKPARDELGGNASAEGRKKRWWHYGRDAKVLYHAIGRGNSFARHPGGWSEDTKRPDAVLAIARVSKTVAFCFVNNVSVFSEATVAFNLCTFSLFAVLQSNLHVSFAWQNASKLKNDLRYSPSDALETFPFPRLGKFEQELEKLGSAYSLARSGFGRSEKLGLTAIYKRFSDPKITSEHILELRDLQMKIDEVVLAAYGWHDIVLNHGFHSVAYLPERDNIRFTICEVARLEILRRLFRLNKERWQREQDEALGSVVAIDSLAPQKKGIVRRSRGLNPAQGGLF
jgi:hypothetical protein